MVQTISGENHKGTVLEAFYFFGAIFCMVVTVLGIKFKWFKRRLDLQQLPSNDGIERRNRGQRNDEILSQGVFRKRLEEEVIREAEKFKTPQPIPTRSSTRNLKIPIPHETSSASGRPVSQPSRPTIPPPNNIPRSISLGAISKINYEETQRNGNSHGSAQPSFEKKEVYTKKIFSRYDSRNGSTTQEQNARRPTGLFIPEQVTSDDTFVRNYTEGFGLANKSPSPRYDTDPLPSLALARDEDNEVVDLFEKIRIPKPEPRTIVPATQSRNQMQMAGHSKDDTEA